MQQLPRPGKKIRRYSFFEQKGAQCAVQIEDTAQDEGNHHQPKPDYKRHLLILRQNGTDDHPSVPGYAAFRGMRITPLDELLPLVESWRLV
jgi:hypothetical protein